MSKGGAHGLRRVSGNRLETPDGRFSVTRIGNHHDDRNYRVRDAGPGEEQVCATYAEVVAWIGERIDRNG